MLGLSFAHLLVLAVLALIFIGPEQLPDVARTIARFINEMKRASGALTQSLVDAREETQTRLKPPQNTQAPQAATEPQATEVKTSGASTDTPGEMPTEKPTEKPIKKPTVEGSRV